MKTIPLLAFALIAAVAAPAFAGPGKTYPISGTAVEVDSQYVVVEGDGKKVQMDRVGATQITGDLKTGDKVSVEYYLVAKDIKVTSPAKPAPAPAAAKPPAAPAPAPATVTPPAPPAPAPAAAAPAPAPAPSAAKPAEPAKIEPPKPSAAPAKADEGDDLDGDGDNTGKPAAKGKEKSGGLLDGIFKK